MTCLGSHSRDSQSGGYRAFLARAVGAEMKLGLNSNEPRCGLGLGEDTL